MAEIYGIEHLLRLFGQLCFLPWRNYSCWLECTDGQCWIYGYVLLLSDSILFNERGYIYPYSQAPPSFLSLTGWGLERGYSIGTNWLPCSTKCYIYPTCRVTNSHLGPHTTTRGSHLHVRVACRSVCDRDQNGIKWSAFLLGADQGTKTNSEQLISTKKHILLNTTFRDLIPWFYKGSKDKSIATPP